MEQIKERVTGIVRALPVAHRVGIVAALGVLAIALVMFASWVTSPAFTVLYAGLDDESVAGVIDGLETRGVPYELEAGGSTVLVPREQLYETRAALAEEGFAGRTAPSGYELLEEQGLSVSEFRQRVDYQRALEGELSRTLSAMDGVREAKVHLVMPEESLFSERQQPVTASVMLEPTARLGESEVEAVAFLTASAVQGLDIDQITIADADGSVLHAPGDSGGASVATNRNMRQTREFEEALAADVRRLLETTTPGSPASVVVRAQLNYDVEETETETYNPDSQVALREQLGEERYDGTGAQPGGMVGVDGGPLPEAGESSYERDDELREFAVDQVVARTVAAPGRVEGLSVAIVVDDGTLTGAPAPPVAEIEQLVTAAVGLVPERGDQVAVSTVPVAATEELEPEADGFDVVGALPQMLGALVLLIVAVALFLMTRRRQVVVEDVERYETVELPEPDPRFEPEPRLAPVGAPGESGDETAELRRDVARLVESQPEEIATLLRGWLADRRG